MHENQLEVFTKNYFPSCQDCIEEINKKLIWKSITYSKLFLISLKTAPYVFFSIMETFYFFDEENIDEIKELIRKINRFEYLISDDNRNDKDEGLFLELRQEFLETLNLQDNDIEDQMLLTEYISVFKENNLDFWQKLQEKLISSLGINSNLEELKLFKGNLFDLFFNRTMLYKDLKVDPQYTQDLKKNIPVYGKNPLELMNLYYKYFMKHDKKEKIDYYTFLYSLFHSGDEKRNK